MGRFGTARAGTLGEKTHTWAIVTPVFEDADAAARLFDDLKAALGEGAFVVAVDDGSVRAPLSAGVLADVGLDGVVVRLRRNVGHQRAIAVGLNYAADHLPGLPCIVMDSDGEDIPSSARLLIDDLAEGGADVVVASRRNRSESWKFRFFYAFYKAAFGALTGRRISFGNFMIIQPEGVRRLCAMTETWIHLAASVLVSRLRVRLLPIDRGSRYSGESKMGFTSLALHGFRAITVLAEDVMVRLGALCTLISLLSIAGILTSIILKVAGMASPGWFSVALGLLTLMLIQTGALVLIFLFMTGIARNINLVATDYRGLIDRVDEARAAAVRESALHSS